MDDLKGTSGGEGNEPISLVAFKYAVTPFPAQTAFCGDSSGTYITVGWLFYLLQYRGHNILIDTGAGDPAPFRKYGFHLDAFREPVRLLGDYGLKPEDISDVIITHLDFDHIADIHHYTYADIYINSAEMQERGERIENKNKVHTFDTSMRLYDMFTIEHIGGHTVGSSIVTFPHGEREYVLAGDECYVNASLEKGIPTGNSFDPEKSRAFVEKYSRPEYMVWFCHEPSVVEGDTGYRVILP